MASFSPLAKPSVKVIPVQVIKNDNNLYQTTLSHLFNYTLTVVGSEIVYMGTKMPSS